MNVLKTNVLIKVMQEETDHFKSPIDRENAKKKRMKALSKEYHVEQPDGPDEIESFFVSHVDKWCSVRFGGDKHWFEGVVVKSRVSTRTTH